MAGRNGGPSQGIGANQNTLYGQEDRQAGSEESSIFVTHCIGRDRVFGPTAAAARLEGSKGFLKVAPCPSLRLQPLTLNKDFLYAFILRFFYQLPKTMKVTPLLLR
jgi:hypothetical protein